MLSSLYRCGHILVTSWISVGEVLIPTLNIIGWMYYIYMAMFAVFCTNSINILAGINGVETSQALVIAISVGINDLLYINGEDEAASSMHLFSLYLLIPFIAVCMALYTHNR